MFREWNYRILVTSPSSSIGKRESSSVGKRDSFFVGRRDGRVSAAVIEKRLRDVIRDVRRREGRGERCVPVGRMTADERDLWASVSRFTHFII